MLCLCYDFDGMSYIPRRAPGSRNEGWKEEVTTAFFRREAIGRLYDSYLLYTVTTHSFFCVIRQ